MMNFKDFFKKNRIEIAIVIALFLIAFGIRMAPSENFPNIYGFDSFYSARSAKYLITEGYVWPTNDSVTDYPFNRLTIYPGDLGWIGLNAIVYKAIAIPNGIEGFDYGLFGSVASWMTAIVGSLAIPAVYLFGRYGFSRWVGLAAALLLIGSSGHLFYSIYGHAENDALGFTLFFLILFSFIMTVKKRSWKFGILTLLLLEWVLMTWQVYNVAVLLMGGTIAAYFMIYGLLSSFGYYKESEERRETRKWMIYALLFALPSIFRWDMLLFRGFLGGALTLGVTALAGSAVLASLIEIYMNKIKISKENLKKNPIIKSLGIASVVGLIFIGLYGVNVITDPLSYIGFDLIPAPAIPDYNQRLLTTIAEQNPIGGANFFERLGTLSNSGFGITVWLAFLSIVFIIGKILIMPFLRKDFTYEWDIMVVALVFYSMWTLTSQAITMFFLAGAIAFGAGYILGNLPRIADIIKKKAPIVKNYLHILSIIAILLVGFSFINAILPSAASYGYDVPNEWFETFDWINEKAPANSVITMWWDYGHWVNYFNGDNKSHPIYTNLDNIQDRADMIFTVASAFTHTPPCKQEQSGDIICDSSEEDLERAELESLSLLRPLATTHILVDKEVALGKFNALMTIANQYQGCFQNFGCQKLPDGSVRCPAGAVSQGDQQITVGFDLPAEKWEQLKEPWPGTAGPLPITTFDTGQVVAEINSRWFAKEESGGINLYGSGVSCGNAFFQNGANANAPIVYTLAHRIFFNDPSLKHMNIVFDNGWNAIYQVNFSEVPNPKNFTDWTKTRAVVCDEPYSVYCKDTDPYAF
jgi:asparagine N-glycosylation enzyme membrane subunit Stt3